MFGLASWIWSETEEPRVNHAHQSDIDNLSDEQHYSVECCSKIHRTKALVCNYGREIREAEGS